MNPFRVTVISKKDTENQTLFKKKHVWKVCYFYIIFFLVSFRINFQWSLGSWWRLINPVISCLPGKKMMHNSQMGQTLTNNIRKKKLCYFYIITFPRPCYITALTYFPWSLGSWLGLWTRNKVTSAPREKYDAKISIWSEMLDFHHFLPSSLKRELKSTLTWRSLIFYTIVPIFSYFYASGGELWNFFTF